ncbi:LicD family protein [bacterium]|nr:LicD family protein [bacterium]
MEKSQNGKLKSKLLEMMEWFHSFCVKNNIRYYVLGGTMLGAVRHQGFIPWDDDIDVGIPSEDYVKLNELFLNSGQSKYLFESPETDADDFFYSFSKLYDTATTLIENTRCKIKRGIYIDIFPLAGMGNDERESSSRFRMIDNKFKYLLARSTGIRKGRSFYKNMVVNLVGMIPDFISKDKARLLELNRLAGERPFFEYKIGGNPFGAWRDKEIMESSIMGKPVLYNFEHIKVFGAEKADEYLTHLYGNWRELPPVEKRMSHHDYIMLDLETPYIQNR